MMSARIGRRDINLVYAESAIDDINDLTPDEVRIAAFRHLSHLMNRAGCTPSERAILRSRVRSALTYQCLDMELVDAEINEYLIDEGDIEPAPIDTTYKTYPVASLPEPLRSYVRSASASIGCDPSYIALPLFAVMAGAIGATRRVAIKSDWAEPAVIWTAVVGDSGSQKSPALSAAVEPAEAFNTCEN